VDKNMLPPVALVAGLCLILLSFAWVTIRRASAPVWTAEQERAYSEATVEWRALSHSHDDAQRPKDPAEKAKITERYQQQVAQFKAAENRGSLLAALFWWGGLLCVLGGVGGFVYQRVLEQRA
jgi:hypothetical protein